MFKELLIYDHNTKIKILTKLPIGKKQKLTKRSQLLLLPAARGPPSAALRGGRRDPEIIGRCRRGRQCQRDGPIRAVLPRPSPLPLHRLPRGRHHRLRAAHIDANAMGRHCGRGLHGHCRSHAAPAHTRLERHVRVRQGMDPRRGV